MCRRPCSAMESWPGNHTLSIFSPHPQKQVPSCCAIASIPPSDLPRDGSTAHVHADGMPRWPSVADRLTLHSAVRTSTRQRGDTMERLRNIGGAHCMVFRRNYEEFEGTVTV